MTLWTVPFTLGFSCQPNTLEVEPLNGALNRIYNQVHIYSHAKPHPQHDYKNYNNQYTVLVNIKMIELWDLHL